MEKREQLKKMITFKQNEKDLFDHLNTKRNISVYVKDLIEADMNKKPIESYFPTDEKTERMIKETYKEEVNNNNKAYDDF